MNAYYTGRSGKTIYTSKYLFVRREMPYGCYYCADGREVLHDRDYKPICQRYPGQAPTLADAAEWVQKIVRREWFYDDGTSERQKRERAAKKLEEWEMTEPVMRQIEQLVLMGEDIDPRNPHLFYANLRAQSRRQRRLI